jgi:hypothetical protein
MKREELKALELSDENIEAIMKLHGQDVEETKNKLTQAEKEKEGLQAQLDEANKAIKGFEGLDVAGIKAAAADWEAKAKQAKEDADAEIAKLKFDHALEAALTGAKAKNPKAVKALLDMEALKLNEADGSVIGLNEQIEKVKTDNDYLFESETPAPTFAKGGKTSQLTDDAIVAAARQAAGLVNEQESGKDK